MGKSPANGDVALDAQVNSDPDVANLAGLVEVIHAPKTVIVNWPKPAQVEEGG